MTQTRAESGSKPLKRRTIASLGAVSVPLASLSLPLVAYLPEYYSGPLGLNLSLVGAIFMIVRLLDIAVDPVIGGLMDNTRSRWGRFRPWLVLGAPLIMLGIGALFMAQRGVGPLYLGFWLVATYVGWSILSLAQLALAAGLSPQYNERSRIYAWWQALFFVGMMSAMALPKVAALAGFKSPSDGMMAMAWLVIIITPITVLLALWQVPELPAPKERAASGLKEYFGLLRRDGVRRLLAAEMLLGLAFGTASSMMLFFFTRVKDVPREDVGLYFLAGFMLGFLFTPIWTPIAQRIGKHRALMVAAFIFLNSQGGMIFAPAGNQAVLAMLFGGTGIAQGAVSLLPRAMMADVGDEERLEGGADRIGLLYALLIGVWKIGQAVSVGGVLFLLDYIGFNATPGAMNTPAAISGLTALFVALPCLFCVAAILSIFGFPLTAKRHAEIRKALDARDAASAPQE